MLGILSCMYLVLRCKFTSKTNMAVCQNKRLWHRMAWLMGSLSSFICSTQLWGAECAGKVLGKSQELKHDHLSLSCMTRDRPPQCPMCQCVMIDAGHTWFRAAVIHACLFPIAPIHRSHPSLPLLPSLHTP